MIWQDSYKPLKSRKTVCLRFPPFLHAVNKVAASKTILRLKKKFPIEITSFKGRAAPR